MKLSCLTTICIAFLVSFVGCSKPSEQPKRVPVSGTVLLEGAPLTQGAIRFVPESGRPVGSMIMVDGSFQLSETTVGNPNANSGVLIGTYRIAVSSSVALDEDVGKIHWFAPSRYADFRTSGLVVDIKGPEPNLVVNLSGEELQEEEEDSTDPTSSEVSPEANSTEGGIAVESNPVTEEAPEQ